MSLSVSFNDNSYIATKDSDACLTLRISSYSGTHYLSYDFNSRMLLARTGDSSGGLNITQFSQLDRESLEAMREKLISLGGKPPELPHYGRRPSLTVDTGGFNP